MKNIILFLMFFWGLTIAHAQVKPASVSLLAPQFVDLKGKPAITVFKNNTGDTLKLSGMFFNYVPYTETNFKLKILPGEEDSLKFVFSYPDFIMINGSFRILNAPGRRVVCTVNSVAPKNVAINFTGDLSQQNAYYLAYTNFLGNYDQEGRPYYVIGDHLKDFNQFPAKADSLTQIRLNFLGNYQKPLPAWFKEHERQRLVYNGIMRKYNVLDSKIFYGGKPIPVDAGYYNFEKDLKLDNDKMLLNTEYLWAAGFYISKKAKEYKKENFGQVIGMIDSLVGNTPVADLQKMDRLAHLYMQSNAKYDSVYASVKFSDPSRGALLDSLIQTRLGLPKIGKKAPDFVLKDSDAMDVSIRNYIGKPVIINFWAVWCGPCIAEFPHENKLAAAYKDKLTIINICVDSDKEQWQKNSAKHHLQMVNLFADNSVYVRLKRAYNIGSLPRSVLIDSNMVVLSNYFKRASLISPTDMTVLIGK